MSGSKTTPPAHLLLQTYLHFIRFRFTPIHGLVTGHQISSLPTIAFAKADSLYTAFMYSSALAVHSCLHKDLVQVTKCFRIAQSYFWIRRGKAVKSVASQLQVPFSGIKVHATKLSPFQFLRRIMLWLRHRVICKLNQVFLFRFLRCLLKSFTIKNKPSIGYVNKIDQILLYTLLLIVTRLLQSTKRAMQTAILNFGPWNHSF